MDLVSDLQKRLSQAQRAMYFSKYPEEFKSILSQTVRSNDGEEITVEELLDTRPSLLLECIRKGEVTDDKYINEFNTYVGDVCRMRINHYCKQGQSWKSVAENPYPKVPSTYGDNYSRHEEM